MADLSLDELIELASTNRGAYDGLLKWARTRPALTDEYKLRIYDVLMRKPPRNGKADTARRNAKLRYIGEILCRDFGMTPTRNELSHNTSAADVLQKLVPHLTVKAIQDILTRRP